MEGKIDCIANNEEKYLSFTKQVIADTFTNELGKLVHVKRALRSINSFRFMATRLDTLVNNLPRDKFINLLRYYQGQQLELLVFPYDWFDHYDKLNVTTLPFKEEFYSKLTGESISDEDHQHVKNIWDTFALQNIRALHDLYINGDVLQLSDVFENFRDLCMETYKLDPLWYYNASSLAWDACLKITGVRSELLRVLDIIFMIEEGTRGGV